MKFSAAFALIVFVGLVANSSALPAKKRMVYLAQQQQPQWYGAPQRMMYVQYVQPSHTHARSTQAAAALVAGESVATGTYLNDCDHAEADIAVAGLAAEQHGEDALGAADAVQSIAEAYPGQNELEQEAAVDAQVAGDAAVDVEADVAVDVEVAAGDVAAEGATVEGAAVEDAAVEGAAVDGATVELEVENTDAKVPRDFNFDAAAEVEAAAVEVPAEEPLAAPAAPAVVDVVAELPAPAPIAPVAPVVPAVPVAKPARRYLPASKKVYVELEQSAEADEAEVQDDDDEDGDEVVAAPVNPVRVPNARRPSKKASQNAGAAKPTKAPLPSGSFFPIDFGGTSGGAIAIANSFSTGEGGSATSHAIAYGSPDAARSRSRPSKIH